MPSWLDTIQERECREILEEGWVRTSWQCCQDPGLQWTANSGGIGLWSGGDTWWSHKQCSIDIRKVPRASDHPGRLCFHTDMSAGDADFFPSPSQPEAAELEGDIWHNFSLLACSWQMFSKRSVKTLDKELVKRQAQRAVFLSPAECKNCSQKDLNKISHLTEVLILHAWVQISCRDHAEETHPAQTWYS